MFNSIIFPFNAIASLSSGNARLYVPWDVDFLYGLLNGLRADVGTIFTLAMYCFIAVTGVYLVINIFSRFAG